MEVTDPATVAELNAGAPPGPSHLFRLDVDEVVWSRVGTPADHLLIDLWRDGAGITTFRR